MDTIMARKMPEGLDWKSFTPDDSPLTPDQLLADHKTIDLSTAKVEPGGPAFDFDPEAPAAAITRELES